MSKMRMFLAACFGAATAVSLPSHAQSSPSAYTSAIRYDLSGRVVGMIAPDPDGAGPLAFAAARTTYDVAGRQTKFETGELAVWQSETVLPSAWTGFTVFSSVESTYDATGRKITEVTKGSDTIAVSLVQFSYSSRGLLECTAQRMNPAIYGSLPASACSLGTEGSFGPDRITRNVYGAVGQLLKIQKAYGTALQEDYATYTYSPNGKQTSLTDARGYKASMTYDAYDRQVKWNFPSPTTPGVVSTTDYEEYGYDANGNRTSLRKRDGSTITYQYDALNRSIAKFVPERSGLATTHTRDVYYGYDLRGLPTYARFDSAAGEGLTSVYDGFGRMISSALTMDGATRTLAYTPDMNGNRTELTWPDAAKTSYSYDGLDRMNTLYHGGIGSTVGMVNYTYNPRGLRATQVNRYLLPTTFGYDPAGRLNALSHDVGGGATTYDVAFTYSYTPASQVAQVTRANDLYAWNGHYNVDRNYTANGLNQYTAAGAAAFGYDANGNLTSDGSTTYVYDVENRLVSASGAKTATLRYDPLGRLYETVGGGATTRFLHDGDELVAEYDGAGTMLRRYAHGKNVDDPVLWYEGSSIGSTQRWLHTDHQGSVIAVTNAAGTAIAINSYDEYGIPKAGNVGRFQYTGQAWIPELGMYYYKARIYSPTLGRFMQTDPIGYEDQVNLYAYVANDSVNKRDPTGKCPNCLSGIVGGVIGGVVSGGFEIYDQVSSGEDINLGDIGRETVAGTVGGAVTGFTGSPTLGGAAQAVAGDVLNGKTPSVANAVAGAASGYVGGKFGDRVTRGLVGNQRFGAMTAGRGTSGILSNNGKVALRTAENTREGTIRVAGQVAGEATANGVVPSGDEIVVTGRRLGLWGRIKDALDF